MYTYDYLYPTAKMVVVETLWPWHTLIVINSWSYINWTFQQYCSLCRIIGMPSLCIGCDWNADTFLTATCMLKHCVTMVTTKQSKTVFVSAPECRDIETALYDRTSVRAYVRTYVRTSLAYISYVIKRWLRALQLKQSTQKWLWLLMNILTRTMNTLSGLWILSMNGAVWLSCCTQDCSQLS